MESMSNGLRNEVHDLVNGLPDRELMAAQRYLKYLREQGDDPVLRALEAAPLDDEAESPEEAAAIEQALEEVARGDVLTTEQLRRELGI
jgi:hypothetical protein